MKVGGSSPAGDAVVDNVGCRFLPPAGKDTNKMCQVLNMPVAYSLSSTELASQYILQNPARIGR